MYLHLGQNTIVPYRSVIGVFDLDITSQSKITRQFLASEENSKRVVNVSDDLPRSFVVCEEERRARTYISQLSTATLQKRVTSEPLIQEIAKNQYGGQNHGRSETQ